MTGVVHTPPALLGALGMKQTGILSSTLALVSYCVSLLSFEGETAGVAGLCS